MTSIADIRTDYARASLDIADVDANPLRQFRRWFDEALKAEVAEVNAMTLATVDPHGQPSARIVLLKNLDERGFTFFTNYASHKGEELAENPRAALLFHWIGLERQVRVQGIVEKVSDAESDAYYHSRPLGSRLGAWASEQSSEVPDRTTLEAREAEYRARFGDAPPRPPHWGGYRLLPQRLEFWQGRPSRLHDRLEYRKQADGSWKIVRLAP
ncbi:pyridoxamine 5'-phosphate oxidase [Ralstonia sp. L16]|uniref:Pyridoxine/pyridoxamine 5'-phosphate oxidase n=1 Tax=Ralstonia wenshanensis TaxID=2842456 RepID=A0AAD2EJE4_9RALS|nr:pyridoxamine 5'-phosphate oxidase [Ralstonia wenshanensis]CAJ0687034.1 Pyridoxine/pyridoxamine 5'-phosphate oxidase [Ralstonia wenshanensis]